METRKLWNRWMQTTAETLEKPIIVIAASRKRFIYQLPGHTSEYAPTLDEALVAVDAWWAQRLEAVQDGAS